MSLSYLFSVSNVLIPQFYQSFFCIKLVTFVIHIFLSSLYVCLVVYLTNWWLPWELQFSQMHNNLVCIIPTSSILYKYSQSSLFLPLCFCIVTDHIFIHCASQYRFRIIVLCICLLNNIEKNKLQMKTITIKAFFLPVQLSLQYSSFALTYCIVVLLHFSLKEFLQHFFRAGLLVIETCSFCLSGNFFFILEEQCCQIQTLG